MKFQKQTKMKKTILILTAFALLVGSCGQKAKQQTAETANSKVTIEQTETIQNQSERKVKHFFCLDGNNAVCFDDGTSFSCYDYYNNEKSTGCIEPYDIEPNTTYKEYTNYLLIEKDKWGLFNDFGHILSGWQIINHYRIYSPLQITNLISDLSTVGLSQDDNVQYIEETCLIFITPENGAEEWMWYMDDRKKEFAEKGIQSVDAKEKYLSFKLYDNEQISIDTKKEQNGTTYTALLYRKGYIPIMISISGESEEGKEWIEAYLSESGDGYPPFERWKEK
jgi:hypothetical protein